ncbi:membrane protein [Nostoc linckia z18]|jgi:uncharacterized membrane protein|uniref:Membrane protein n=2 Tax=Nostoc linckia TaxID=92942 RepID=A0A9Q5Z8G8_NOSLI|nr:DUF1634 domain-containing protein [Nostoc linckia]PHK43827.1 membrane protein [Nostoc linckia z16]PHJ66121.1 membrane protein [Nostoc linckia z3]PHJ68715.1 membrane protein [Nostoc linckia z1]PHJ74025.1 membrane protein [Nostoc linckia z2]PHJ83889.1 membrane protein [Nostoc linckia z4]
MVKSRRSKSEQRFEQFLGNLLRIGVIIATALVLIGGTLYLIRHGTEAPNYQFFRGELPEFRSPSGVVKSVESGRRRGIIQLGLLVLIATPVIRVACSLFAYVRQRDFTYIIVTLIVLFGLLYSLIGGYI